MDDIDCVNIFLSEGAGVKDIVAQMEAKGEEVPRDAFGHVSLAKINPGQVTTRPLLRRAAGPLRRRRRRASCHVPAFAPPFALSAERTALGAFPFGITTCRPSCLFRRPATASLARRPSCLFRQWFAATFGPMIKAEKVLVQKSGYFARSAAANAKDRRLIEDCADKAVESALKSESG